MVPRAGVCVCACVSVCVFMVGGGTDGACYCSGDSGASQSHTLPVTPPTSSDLSHATRIHLSLCQERIVCMRTCLYIIKGKNNNFSK